MKTIMYSCWAFAAVCVAFNTWHAGMKGLLIGVAGCIVGLVIGNFTKPPRWFRRLMHHE